MPTRILSVVRLSIVLILVSSNCWAQSDWRPDAFDATYQQRIGTAYGPAVMGNIYFTFFTYFGIGVGFYKSFAKSVNHSAVEITFFEFNLPISLSK
jgi:hypothetical protein